MTLESRQVGPPEKLASLKWMRKMDDLILIKIELKMLHEGMTSISRRFEELLEQSNYDHDVIEELRNINQLARQLVESTEIVYKKVVSL